MMQMSYVAFIYFPFYDLEVGDKPESIIFHVCWTEELIILHLFGSSLVRHHSMVLAISGGTTDTKEGMSILESFKALTTDLSWRFRPDSPFRCRVL